MLSQAKGGTGTIPTTGTVGPFVRTGGYPVGAIDLIDAQRYTIVVDANTDLGDK